MELPPVSGLDFAALRFSGDPANAAGLDGQIVFDLIAEITQERHVRASTEGPAFTYYGGSTVILGPTGDIRYVVLKNVVGAGRLERRRAFFETACGQKYCQLAGNRGCRFREFLRWCMAGIDLAPTNTRFAGKRWRRCNARHDIRYEKNSCLHPSLLRKKAISSLNPDNSRRLEAQVG